MKEEESIELDLDEDLKSKQVEEQGLFRRKKTSMIRPKN
jgi:hypothetical protein